jgi:hypothetical protein
MCPSNQFLLELNGEEERLTGIPELQIQSTDARIRLDDIEE